MSNIRIINKTGITNDTKVYVNDVEVKGIISLEIDPVLAFNQLVTATMKVHVVDLDVVADVSN